jgi:glycosyltransferase involved in cell wall biosynthesis
MRVSIISLNLIAEDAIGTCMINQVRFFRRRGDDAHVYVLHPPHRPPTDVAAVTNIVTLDDLIGSDWEHFRLSDLYIFHYPGYYELLESMRQIERGTVVFYYHNVTPPELWGADADRAALVQGMQRTDMVHCADLCITVSPFNKQDLVERVGYDPDRIHVLPLAVPLDQFTPGDRDPALVQRYNLEGRRVLLFVGRMAGNKRVDLLIEALAQIKSQIADAKLLLVGDDQSNAALRHIVAAAQARAAELGVAGDVIWAGRVDELQPYYRLADVYVTASLHEGFGVPLIEAMASGVPVVASRAGAMPWVLGDAGLLCEPGDAAGLAHQVLKILQDAALHQSLVEHGLERAQSFSLERYEAGLAEIVDGIVTYVLPEIPSEASLKEEENRRNALLLDALASEIRDHSDVALRGYVVRSRAPLVGPLIAWVRRNLTSHLREPYLDPTIERQVALNQRLAEWLKQATTALDTAARREVELETRIQALEAQVETLTHRLDEGASPK